MQTIVQTIPEPLLQQVSERVERRTGLYFPRERFADLERGLVQVARDVGYPETRAYVESLLNRKLDAADLEALAGSLTIAETHFFRDPRFFAFLESTLLPELIAAKRGGGRRLRIWSAGCATGEEPYSLAILLHRLIPDLAGWRISILGTDINPKALARAAAGIYSDWAFRDTPEWVKPGYFIARSGGRYEIQPWVKRMVGFACLNLADDVFPSVPSNTTAMDLIVCRNVLLYFARPRIPQVVHGFQRALVDGGLLVLGAVEANLMTFSDLAPVPAPGMALYRKESGSRNAEHGERGTRKSERETEDGSAVEPVAFADPLSDGATAARRFGVRRLDAALDVTQNAKRGSPPPEFRVPSSEFGLLARRHADLGELAEALVWCERALATAKTDPALHFLRAGVLQELHRDDQALLALRNVLFLDDAHVLAHFAMANLHRRQHRMPAAARHLANVRQLLAYRDENEELPHSDGFTVGRMNGLLAAMGTKAARKRRRDAGH